LIPFATPFAHLTLSLIAHRLSSIQAADNIIVMAKGKVMERGTYNHLVSLGGLFCSLIQHQTSSADSKASSSAQPPPSPTISTVSPVPLERVISSVSHKSAQNRVAVHSPCSSANTDNANIEDLLESGKLAGSPPRNLLARYAGIVSIYWRFVLPGIIFSLVLGGSFPVAGWLTGQVVQTFTIQGNDAELRRQADRWSFWFLMIAVIDMFVSAGSST
jgi:ATP-binding cassette, subfamily B (MDR/TAP), member 1